MTAELAGAAHQEVHVRLKGKIDRIAVFAPCELVAVPGAAAEPSYESISRQEFLARVRRWSSGRVVVRVLAEP